MRLPVDLIRFFFSTRKMANIRSDQIKRDSLTYPEATSKLKITVTYFSFELALSVGIQVAPSSLCLSNELIISCSLFSLKLRCLFCIFQLNSAIIKLHEKKSLYPQIQIRYEMIVTTHSHSSHTLQPVKKQISNRDSIEGELN